MLTLSRKPGESITFPDLGITIEISAVHGNKVSVGIDAPREYRIVRSELTQDPASLFQPAVRMTPRTPPRTPPRTTPSRAPRTTPDVTANDSGIAADQGQYQSAPITSIPRPAPIVRMRSDKQ